MPKAACKRGITIRHSKPCLVIVRAGGEGEEGAKSEKPKKKEKKKKYTKRNDGIHFENVKIDGRDMSDDDLS